MLCSARIFSMKGIRSKYPKQLAKKELIMKYSEICSEVSFKLLIGCLYVKYHSSY